MTNKMAVDVSMDDLLRCKSELEGRLEGVEGRLKGVDGRLVSIESDTKRTLEIIEAWNNAKGFVNVVRGISATIRVLWWPFVLIAAIVVFLKTGNWQWPGK